MSIIHLFIAILAILLVSIAFTVINWIFQLKLFSRVAALEKELEKKNLAFDALKKEKTSAARSAVNHAAATVIDVPSLIDMHVQQQLTEDNSIQVVRNVGGVFKTARADPAVYSNAVADDRSTAGVPFSQKSHPAPTPSFEAPKQREPESVPNARAEAPAVPERLKEHHEIVLPLFSPAAGGPDMVMLYESLTEAMKTNPGPVDPVIGIDCSGVQQLNDQDLEYLEKLHQSLSHFNRSLVFLHCTGNLSALMRRRPAIASLVR